MATQRLLRSIAPPSTGRAAAVETLADNDAKQRESAAIAAAKQLASWKPSSDPPPPKQRPPAKLSGAVVRESSALLDANALLMQHIRQARPNEPAPRTRAKRHTHTHTHTHILRCNRVFTPALPSQNLLPSAARSRSRVHENAALLRRLRMNLRTLLVWMDSEGGGDAQRLPPLRPCCDRRALAALQSPQP